MTTNTHKKANFSVIIVAAGTASRFGGDLPKQYLKIADNKTVLEHTIAAFKKCEGLKNICIVIHPDHEDLYSDATKNIDGLMTPVQGGKTRQESVYNALSSLSSLLNDDDFVLVHDAARPCVAPHDIERVVDALSQYQAVTLASAIPETLRMKDHDELGTTIDRESLLSIQTPQGFRFGVLKNSHEKFKGESYTDDTTLVSAYGIKSSYVIGPRTNIKITTPEDLEMASFILSSSSRCKSGSSEKDCQKIPAVAGMTEYMIKTGMGFDVHAFGDPADHIRLGGIDIPYTHKLAGHSDADVVLHAITDALYGSIADGDIGSHFPPSDQSHKGKDSAIFLSLAADAVKERGGTLNHVDVTVICEAPKVGPHREKIRERIASIINLPLSRVAVKATTTEKLGFTGRGEGIAAQAIVTISIPESQ